MDIFHAIILGVVQGLTEFLPISSSGHLILVPKFLGWPDQGLGFDAMVHLGTAIAAIYHYRHDCHRALRSLFQRHPTPDDRQLRNAVLIGSVPALVAAILLKDVIDEHARNVTLVAANLIVWGVVLIAADWYASRQVLSATSQTRTPRQAIVVGLAQALALFPGTSRSGITISAGLFVGLDRSAAVRFSFLLGLPIILGVSLLSGVELLGEVRAGEISAAPLMAGLAAAFIGGLAAIRFLLAVISRNGLTYFALYRFALAAVILFTLR